MTKRIRYVIIAIAASFAFAAPAQAICTGSGIHQSCLSKSGYSNPYQGTQINGNNAAAHTRWYQNSQTVGGKTYSKGALYGTQLNSATQTYQKGKQGYQATAQTYEGIKNSRPSFVCDQGGCRQQ